MLRILFFIVVCFAVTSAQDTLDLEEVVIKSSLLLTQENALPVTISTWSDNGNFRSIEKELNNVPGVWLTNNSNAAQDYRISIRGFGSRASFGVRGIRILLDGIPQTTPDGQSQIDHLPHHLIQQSEVIRSPAGSRHGNAAGGVLSFFTENTNRNQANIRLQHGSFGLYSTDATIHHRLSDNSKIMGSLNYHKFDGYRKHADFENKSAFVKFTHQKNEVLHKLSILHFDSPYAFDSGGLTLEEVNRNRSQGRERNMIYDAGESVRQSQIAWHYKTPYQSGELETSVHFSPRVFDGKLPFENGGIVKVERDFYGGMVLYRTSAKKRFGQGIVGLDFQNQRDHRKRYANRTGVKGEQAMNQIEHFSSASGFAIWSVPVGKSIFDLGIRYDNNQVALDDRFAISEQSYERQFNRWSPHLGFLWKSSPTTAWFISLGSGFEVPALSELSANPYGSGFNHEIQPMSFNSLDFGFRKQNPFYRWEAVAFYTTATNELIRYELEDFPDQNFYRNLGESTRYGIEVDASLIAFKDHMLQGGISFASYKFSEDGTQKNLPGVPTTTANLRWTYSNNNWKFSIDGRFIGDYFADNANAVRVDHYGLANLEIQKHFQLKSTSITLGCSIFNLTETRYFDNIRINAFGSRFYEPAGGRQLLFSIKTGFE
jgi:iron complex outermembrane receptor protein